VDVKNLEMWIWHDLHEKDDRMEIDDVEGDQEPTQAALKNMSDNDRDMSQDGTIHMFSG